ncbi:MAG TPA: acyl-CoA dehydrogenase [Phycisphaerales bacterium]|nr:acyl-CoA dehydrogenase [Phycisphaerales bacterium]
MKGLSARDQKMIADAEVLLGPDPEELGFVKNLFCGHVREDLVFPYPRQDAEETARCDQLLAALDDYFRTEHPALLIDQEQEIPRWVIDRLFTLGVMGMTIPREFGGLGMGVTSYVRVLEKIGSYCGSTAVLVSAHQSIGCKAVLLFGNDEQKRQWLPHLAKDWVSAFCLSEPNVGCDAGGQETRCEKTPDGEYYILNGEKKWATSGAISGLFTVMAKQKIIDPKTGKEQERVTALVCAPDMDGVDIFQKNRSKCGIRGTWQARIRFNNVRVPKAHLLHQEGKGLNVALTCLNYGRCTLSAGMLGSARRCMDQGIKWARTRHQFQRPLSDFDLVQQKIASMAALCYAMDAMLYMTTGFLDRHDKDIMVETAVCKTFCSEMGWRVVNDAMQIMGGESYMTENEVERAFRDSRINLIVEGANEVMQKFVFAYGGKALAEQMIGVKDRVGWDHRESLGANLSRIMKHAFQPVVMGKALPLALELFLGLKPAAPRVTRLHPSLAGHADRFARLVREHSHQFKLASKEHEEKILDRDTIQARIADNAIYLHAMACVLSRLDQQLRDAQEGAEFERDRSAALAFLDMAELWMRDNWRHLREHCDDTMRRAAAAAIAHNDAMPNALFSIPERSPTAKGTGRTLKQEGIRQFPGDRHKAEAQRAHTP